MEAAPDGVSNASRKSGEMAVKVVTCKGVVGQHYGMEKAKNSKTGLQCAGVGLSYNYWWICTSDVPALAWPESPGFGLALGGFRWLWLEEIVSQAQSQKSSLAWPGFGLSQGFWWIHSNSHFLTFKLI
jgi:hypothetical protein